MMPYITEQLWQYLNASVPARTGKNETLLIDAVWPSFSEDMIDLEAEESFKIIMEVVRGIRNARKHNNTPPGKMIDAVAELQKDTRESSVISGNAVLLSNMAGFDSLEIMQGAVEQPPGSAIIPAGSNKIYLLDIVDTIAEKKRLEKEIGKLRNGVDGIKTKLENQDFVDRAPAEVIDRERERLRGLERELKTAEEALVSIR